MKTKLFFLVILVTFVTNSVFSQDIIVKKDKSTVRAKIIEIGETSIKYNLFEFPNEPPRIIQISNIREIIYESGRVETFGDVEEAKETVKETKVIVPVQTEVKAEVSAKANEPVETQQNVSYYPWGAFGRISAQLWNNVDLSEFFGTNMLYGGGIEKQIFNHFIIGADFDFASKTKDEMTLTYTQIGGFIKFSWANFGTKTLLLYSQFGVRGVSFKNTEADYSSTATGIGFSALLGLEIPLGEKVTLNLAWDSVFANVTSEGETTKAGSEIFSGGIIIHF
jgi:hypothetical protein